MKIMIFTDYFLPGVNGGGPVTSILNLASLLSTEHEVVLVTRNRDIGSEQAYSKEDIHSFTATIPYEVIYLSKVSLSNVYGVIKDERPQVIYSNSFFSLFTIYINICSIFYTNSRYVMSPRGELLKDALSIKPLKKKVYIFFYKVISNFFDTSYLVSDVREANEINKLFNSNYIKVLPNLSIPKKCEISTQKEKETRYVFVSRIVPNKNLDIALKSFAKVNTPCLLDIYGPIEDESYWETCKNLININNKYVTITYKGALKPADVSTTLVKYDSLVFPTETENFGHVIVESIICGLVPIISNRTPWTQLKKQGVGWDIEPNDINLFTSAIEELNSCSDLEYKTKVLLGQRYITKKLNVTETQHQYLKFFTGLK